MVFRGKIPSVLLVLVLLCTLAVPAIGAFSAGHDDMLPCPTMAMGVACDAMGALDHLAGWISFFSFPLVMMVLLIAAVIIFVRSEMRTLVDSLKRVRVRPKLAEVRVRIRPHFETRLYARGIANTKVF